MARWSEGLICQNSPQADSCLSFASFLFYFNRGFQRGLFQRNEILFPWIAVLKDFPSIPEGSGML